MALPARSSVDYPDIDLPVANGDASDLWSDGTTMYVMDEVDNMAYAYDLLSGDRKSADDIAGITVDADHEVTGIAAVGGWLYVGAFGNDGAASVRHYKRGSPNELVGTTDLGAGKLTGLSTDGDRLYISRATRIQIRALDADTGVVAASGSGFGVLGSVWGHVVDDANGLLWTVEPVRRGTDLFFAIHAYDLATGSRLAEKSFFPSGLNRNRRYTALFVRDDHMWIANAPHGIVHAYRYLNNSSGEGEVLVRGEPVVGGVLTPELTGLTSLSDPNGISGLASGGGFGFQWSRTGSQWRGDRY